MIGSHAAGRSMDRRQFGQLAAAGLASLAGFASAQGSPEKAPKGLPGANRKKKGNLFYRPLGATGLWISELALGGSPSPPPNIFSAALERGVNYCDTSPRYGRGKGEQDIGKIIKGRRDQIYLGTKFTPTRDGVMTTDQALKQVEGSLTRFGTDVIDILCVHGARTEEEVLSDWVFDAIERLHKAGKVRFFGASVHNTSLDFNRKMIESGKYQVLLIPFNAYFETTSKSGDTVGAGGTQALASILKLAAEKGVGIIAMKTLAAGGLAKVPVPEGISPAQAKLRWVLKRPEVSSILNEMVTFDYLKEDLAASAADLTPSEAAWLQQSVRAGSDSYCRMCGTCEANCPLRIPIPDFHRARMYAVDYGNPSRAKALAEEIGAVSLLDKCQKCGRCEANCPWGVRTSRLFDDLRRMA